MAEKKVFDFIVIGSGAAGATAAVVLAESGKEVLILEEGKRFSTKDYKEDLYSAMQNLFRDYGNQMAKGRGVIPVLQGCCVGGSTVMNGAICHRLPSEVYDEWCKDEGIRDAIDYKTLEACSKQIEEDLEIRANLAPYLPNLPVSKVLNRLGWSYNPMFRNAPGCQSSGRCLQGCPSGGKLSMELSYIPRAQRAGATLLSSHRVDRIRFTGKRAKKVQCFDPKGQKKTFEARKGIIVAAGAIHTPLLLSKSGIRGAVGKHFQCHLGIGITALLPRTVISTEGPPQGIEITQFSKEGIKLATQLMPPELLLARSTATGEKLVHLLSQSDRITNWTGSVQSNAEGTVTPSILGTPRIRFNPSQHDVTRARTALHRMAHLLFEMGAEEIHPGICGGPQTPLVLKTRQERDRLLGLPLDARNYFLSVGHIFGTCRMGSDLRTSVVDPHFRVHGMENLYVVDASIFPTNTGVNPQHSIMSLAMLATRQLAC